MINLATKNVGLPAKSHMWILTIDYHIKNFLSFVCDKPVFEQYVTSLLKKHYRTKDNAKLLREYLDFLAISDETRIHTIYPTKTFSRGEAIKFISLLKKDIEVIQKFKIRLIKGKQVTHQEAVTYNNFLCSWELSDSFIRLVNTTYDSIQKIIVTLNGSFSSLIIKKLLAGNKLKNVNIEEIQAMSFDIVMSMIDGYMLKRKDEDLNNNNKLGLGKVPFTTQLDWLVKGYKTNLIADEQNEINNFAISIEDEEIKDNLVDDNKEYKKEFSREELGDFIKELIPLPFYQLYDVYYGQLKPVPIEEQLDMITL